MTNALQTAKKTQEEEMGKVTAGMNLPGMTSRSKADGLSMIRHDADFVLTVHAALAETPIGERLGTAGAVIMERITKGGGATRWYYCPDKSQLGAVEERLSPGSAVTFYFDGRIRSAVYSPEVKSNIEGIIIDESEAVIGRLRDDGLHIDVEIVSNLDEIDDFASTINPASRVFYGPFPGRDNDGVRAITVVLPALLT